MTFVKGISGNAAGRPKSGLAVAEAFRKRFSLEWIMDHAADLVDNATDERVRLAALVVILERGHGKVLSTTDITVRDGDGRGARIDWTKVPIDRRRVIIDALTEAGQVAQPIEPDSESDGDPDDTVEH